MATGAELAREAGRCHRGSPPRLLVPCSSIEVIAIRNNSLRPAFPPSGITRSFHKEQERYYSPAAAASCRNRAFSLLSGMDKVALCDGRLDNPLPLTFSVAATILAASCFLPTSCAPLPSAHDRPTGDLRPHSEMARSHALVASADVFSPSLPIVRSLPTCSHDFLPQGVVLASA